MQHKLLIAACASTAVVMSTTGVFAQCTSELRNAFANIDRLAASEEGLSGRDLRRLRQAAQILADAGYTDACLEIADVAKDMPQRTGGSQSTGQEEQQARQQDQARRENDERRSMASDRSSPDRDRSEQMRSEPTSEQRQRMQMANSAVPVTDYEGSLSLTELVGKTVYSTQSGRSVGDVQDLILGSDGREVVIGHGGFLGMGEKRIKVAMEDLRVGEDGSTYFVALSEQRIRNMPGVEKQDGRWVQQAAEAESGLGQGERSEQQDRAEAGEDSRDTQSGTARAIEREAKALVDEARKAISQTVDAPESTGSVSEIGAQRAQLSVNTLIGKPVHSSHGGAKIGEIEDVILTIGSDRGHSVVLGHGGFLGMGEKRIKLQLGDLRYRANDDTYFAALTDEDIKNRPGLEKVDGRWQAQTVKAQKPRDAEL